MLTEFAQANREAMTPDVRLEGEISLPYQLGKTFVCDLYVTLVHKTKYNTDGTHQIVAHSRTKAVPVVDDEQQIEEWAAQDLGMRGAKRAF